jgi:hypothetical protein
MTVVTGLYHEAVYVSLQNQSPRQAKQDAALLYERVLRTVAPLLQQPKPMMVRPFPLVTNRFNGLIEVRLSVAIAYLYAADCEIGDYAHLDNNFATTRIFVPTLAPPHTIGAVFDRADYRVGDTTLSLWKRTA